MVARTETPNASLPWLVRITANCPNLLDAPKRRPFHAALGRAARHSRHYLNPFWRRRNGPSPCRQDERQYNQPGQQHARYKRISKTFLCKVLLRHDVDCGLRSRLSARISVTAGNHVIGDLLGAIQNVGDRMQSIQNTGVGDRVLGGDHLYQF